MQLPDGTVVMHGKKPYDPVKARQYYLRTRQLKGRQKGTTKEAAPRPDQVRYRASLDAFLKKLPMAVEGADLKTVEKFVDDMRGKSDDELVKLAKNMKDTPGTKDASVKSATIQALLANRTRVRGKKGVDKKLAAKNVDLKKQKAVGGMMSKKLIKAG